MNESSIGPYRLLNRIGPGSLGEKYLGEDSRSRRRVVVKLLRPTLRDCEPFWNQLARDRARLKGLRHRHIAQFLDVVEDRGERAIVQEYVRGHSLADEMDARGGSLPLARIYAIWRQLLSAIGHAHSAEVLHLCLRPSKVMIVRAGDEDRVKVLDFGVGPVYDSGNERPDYNIEELDVQHAYYISPDQLHRAVATSEKSDLYSAGVLLYEACTGYVPFGGDDLYDVIRGHLLVRPEPPARLAANIPWHLSAVTLKAIAKHPDDRPEDARDFGYHVIACQTGSVLRVKPRTVRVARRVAAPPDTPVVASVPEEDAEPDTGPQDTSPHVADAGDTVPHEVMAARAGPRVSVESLISRLSDSSPTMPVAPVSVEAREQDEPDDAGDDDENTSLVTALMFDDEDRAPTQEVEDEHPTRPVVGLAELEDDAATVPLVLPAAPPVPPPAPAAKPAAATPSARPPAAGTAAALIATETQRPTLRPGRVPRELRDLPPGVPQPAYLELLRIPEVATALSGEALPDSPVMLVGRIGVGRRGYDAGG